MSVGTRLSPTLNMTRARRLRPLPPSWPRPSPLLNPPRGTRAAGVQVSARQHSGGWGLCLVPPIAGLARWSGLRCCRQGQRGPGNGFGWGQQLRAGPGAAQVLAGPRGAGGCPRSVGAPTPRWLLGWAAPRAVYSRWAGCVSTAAPPEAPAVAARALPVSGRALQRAAASWPT